LSEAFPSVLYFPRLVLKCQRHPKTTVKFPKIARNFYKGPRCVKILKLPKASKIRLKTYQILSEAFPRVLNVPNFVKTVRKLTRDLYKGSKRAKIFF